MGKEHSEEFEWIAGFGHPGTGLNKEGALPEVARTVMLRIVPGKEGRPPTFRERYHVDWRGDLGGLEFDAVIVSGYGHRSFREVMGECRRRGVPVALWSDSNLRGDRGHSLKMRMKRAIKRKALGRLAREANELLTANGRGVAFWRYYGGAAARSKVEICPYYADYRRVDVARASERAEVLGRVGLKAGERFLYSSARLIREKGLDLMIRAFLQLRLGEKGWRYVIGGTGVLEGELKGLAGEEAGKSILFAGFQQPSQNLALMAQAAFMVLPSRYEPHGIVVPESLAAGTPVIVSDKVGAAYGLVRHGRNGLVFRSEDEASLREALGVLEDEGKMAGLRGAARPAFEEWYRRTSPMLVVPRTVRRMLAGGAR
jgi:glycosyltransferase involved in cell wall biosynthesis